MRNILSGIFKTLGCIVFAIFGLWGFIIELVIINEVAGFWGSCYRFYAIACNVCCSSLVCPCCVGKLVSLTNCLWRGNICSSIIWHRVIIKRGLNLLRCGLSILIISDLLTRNQ